MGYRADFPTTTQAAQFGRKAGIGTGMFRLVAPTPIEADQWLQSNIGPLLQQPYFGAGGDGLLIVTFDECDAAVGNCPEHIYTALIGPNVKRSYKSSQSYRHENTLRTILEALAVDGYPGASQHAKPMTDFFN